MIIHPHHILVKYEYEAKDIYQWLQAGKDFADLARKYSQCASHAQGGDLGAVDSRKLDSDFLEAFELLKPHSYSKPVKTRFGWHIIKRVQ